MSKDMNKINKIQTILNNVTIKEEVTEDFLSVYRRNATKPQIEFMDSLSKEQLGILKTLLLDYKFFIKNELNTFIKNNF